MNVGVLKVEIFRSTQKLHSMSTKNDNNFKVHVANWALCRQKMAQDLKPTLKTALYGPLC